MTCSKLKTENEYRNLLPASPRGPARQTGASQGFDGHADGTFAFLAGMPPVKCPRFFPG